ncbi:MAG TPA: ATP-binding cassette domain-containing protein [Syntrophomonadaceae bacterium]|nr:ATP-binding cassette domain-containing protein [Syntrophomonadaceae bacterium]
MITVKHLYKTYVTAHTRVEALQDVNLSVEKGDIFGIIGFSGAGKSTLIRCFNRLEEPDSGSVFIGEHEITALGKRELRNAQRKMGMIFQQFNLFDSRTVFGNVSFPLEVAGVSRKAIAHRVPEILELVGLSDKINFYPAQLSGGQMQRVGIARALANEPDILLSDEATSALDPQTTASILDLLRDLNRQLHLTIILITHELDVLRYICNNMAVLENGRIVEQGSVEKFFLNPESNTARLFIKITESFQVNRMWKEGEGI